MRSRSSVGTPTPVSVTRTTTSPSSRPARTSTRPPSGVNFTAFDTRLSTTCLSRSSSPHTIPTSSATSRPSSMRVRRGPLPDQGEDVGEAGLHRHQARLEDHAPGLDLGEVEDLVEELEQVLARRPDVTEVFLLALVQVAEQPVEEDLGEADDRVERRPELVRHAREELGLVPTGDLQLGPLGVELAEEACIDDGQPRLVGERPEQLGRLGVEAAARLLPDHEGPDQPVARGPTARRAVSASRRRAARRGARRAAPCPGR